MNPLPDPRSIFVQGTPSDSASWIELAREVERLGLGGLYVADHPGTSPSPFVALAAAASVSETITLGTCVVNAGLWHPVDLASAVATLDMVSSGRALLGIGAGHTPSEWTARGLEPPDGGDRLARLEEVVGATRALLQGETVTSTGGRVALVDAHLDPPRPNAEVPLMIGGGGPRLLELAATVADIVGVTGLGRTLADGHTHSVNWTSDQVTASIERIRIAADRAGRRPAVEALVQRIEITDDAPRSADALAASIEGATGADVLAAPYVWLGTAEEIRGSLRRHRTETGIDRWVVRAGALPTLRLILAQD